MGAFSKKIDQVRMRDNIFALKWSTIGELSIVLKITE